MPMKLDDELVALLERVHELFGREVVNAALDRALFKARRRQVPMKPTPQPELYDGYTDGVSFIIPPGVLEDAVRSELRQLARVQ